MATMPYSLWAALVGSAMQQKMTSKLLMSLERQQDETKLLAHRETLPVMLIIGEHDSYIYPDKLGEFVKANFSRSEVVVVKDAGHSAFWEKSVEVNETITRFMDDL